MSLCLTLTTTVLCDLGNGAVFSTGSPVSLTYFLSLHMLSVCLLHSGTGLCVPIFCACEEFQLAVSFPVCHHCPFSFLSKKPIVPWLTRKRKGSLLGVISFPHIVLPQTKLSSPKEQHSKIQQTQLNILSLHRSYYLLFPALLTKRKRKKKENNKENHLAVIKSLISAVQSSGRFTRSAQWRLCLFSINYNKTGSRDVIRAV